MQAADRIAASRQFSIEAARVASQTHCHNIVVLDVSGLSPVTDFFVLASGTSARQMRSVARDIDELGNERDFKSLTRSGYEGESWILLDFVDLIVHVFSDEARQYYDLDNLWGDAKQVQWQLADEPAAV